MELDFHHQFKVAIICSKFTGKNPYQARNSSWALRFFILHGMFTFIAAMFIYTATTYEYDNTYLIKACPCLSLIIAYGYISTNYFLAVKYEKLFRSMMDSMKEDYEIAKQLPPEEKSVVVHYANRGHFVCKLWVFAPTITLTTTFLTSTLVTLYYAIRGIQRYDITVDVFMPGTSDEFRTDSSFGHYIFSQTLFSLYLLYAAPSYVALCPYGPIFMLHAAGQLELLRVRLMRLYPEDGSVSLQERKVKLGEIAKKLQDIYDFVDLIKTSHKLMFEVTLRGTAFITPVLLYQMAKSLERGVYRIEFTLWLTNGAIWLSCIPCYYADVLMSKSAQMREAIYTCKWETEWDKRARSSLLVMMTRTTRLVAIDTIFRVLCLETLTDTFRLVFTLFNAMNTLW